MQSKCPHCDKPIKPGAILCMNCGSYVVKMEEKKRRWHLFAIPAVVVATHIGLVVYMNYKDTENRQLLAAKREAPRTVDPAAARQIEQDEAELKRLVARRKLLEQERRRRYEKRKAAELWKATPTATKQEYLSSELKTVRDRIKSLKLSAQSDATQEFRDWLINKEAKIAAVDTFLEAEQWDQAKGLIEGVRDELDELIGPEEGDDPSEHAASGSDSAAN